MAEYGYQPRNDDSNLKSLLLTGGTAAVGLFALGKSLRPWAENAMKAEYRASYVAARRQIDDLYKHNASTSGDWQVATGELRELHKTLVKNATNVTSTQALGLWIARSSAMEKWTKHAASNQITRLVDDLGMVRLLREQYGLKSDPIEKRAQMRYMGKLGDLKGLNKNLFTGKDALFDTDTHAYYAYGQLFARNSKDKFTTLPGKYMLFGRAASGEEHTWLEKANDELLTHGSERVTELMHKGSKLRISAGYILWDKAGFSKKGIHANVDDFIQNFDFSKFKASDYKDLIKDKKDYTHLRQLGWDIHHNTRTLNRLIPAAGGKNESFHKFARFWDFGLNESGNYFWTEEARVRFQESMLGILHPEDRPILRELDTTKYDVVRGFELNKEGILSTFFGGSNRQTNIGTVGLYHLFRRINSTVESNGIAPWLALSGQSTSFKFWGQKKDIQGPAAYMLNIAFRRAIPLYAAAFYAGYLNDQIGNVTGTRPTDKLREQRGNLDLWWAHEKDKRGISQFSKHVDELSGGALGYIAHPFIDSPVGLSEEELREHQKSGVVPIRKGRWWLFGSSTPFRGERIQYFTPTYNQYGKAGDVYNTSTLWGSSDEFYANAALPTPTHPFAPIKHFITDRYHFEKKHYYDRPYPLTAPLFEATTPWGTVLNPTLGRIIKPDFQMHRDDLPYLITGPNRGQRNPHYRGEIRSINDQIKEMAQSRETVGFVTPGGSIEPMEAVPVPGSDREIARINQDIVDDGMAADAGYDEGVEVGEYGEGARSIVPYGSGKQKTRIKLSEINADLKKHGVAKRFTKGRLLEPARTPGLYPIEDPNSASTRSRLISSNDPRYQLGLGYYSLTELAGIYGFGAVTTTGDLYANLPTVQNAGLMTGFERTYWDRWNAGGLLPTPGLSEAARRFMPHRFHSNIMYNPIRNTMPNWLPGSGGEEPGYFLDFLHSDPYALIPNGETRLPGESYERLHGIPSMDLTLQNTQVGYSKNMVYGFLTGEHRPFAAYNEELIEQGEEAHKKTIRSLANVTGTDIMYHDKALAVRGRVDAILGTGSSAVAVQIHTQSNDDFNNQVNDSRYVSQLNFDLHELGLKQGQLVYTNRDNPDQVRVIDQQFDQDLFNQTVENITSVRKDIVREANQGQWAPGQFYSDLTKFSILADVAPWSQQYKIYRDTLVHLDSDLEPSERLRVQEIKKQVTQRKKRFTMTPYKAMVSDLDYEDVVVKDVIDNNTFTTYQHPDNPIRLAGVHVNSDAPAPFKPHESLRIGYAADQTRKVAHDTLHTIRAVVYRGNSMINQGLIAQGNRATNENTPAGIHVKYSPKEIAYAKKIEYLTHLPVPFIHNKFLPIDSPLELYKRTQVYGKDWQDWKHPFRDYLFPAINTFAQQGIPGAAGAAFLGFMLGNKSKTWAAAFAGIDLVWAATHKDKIPEFRNKERDINEYFDILKYVKYEGLYQKTREWVVKHQHEDIGNIADSYKRDGDKRKKRIQILKAEKRRYIVSGNKAKYADKIRQINKEIHQLQTYRTELPLSREEVLALEYKNMAETTLYGAEPGKDMRRVLLALDSKEREFFQEFLKAPGKERAEILKLVPQNERRFLEATWRMPVEERPELGEYFKSHYLPPPDWKGWHADSALDDYKLVVMKQEGLDLTTHGFWPQDEERVKEQRITDLRPNRPSEHAVASQIRSVLRGRGLTDIDINLMPNGTNQTRSNYKIHSQKRDKRGPTSQGDFMF